VRVRLIGHMGFGPSQFFDRDYSRHGSNIETIIASCMHGCQTHKPYYQIVEGSSPKVIEDRVKSSVKMGHYTVAGFADFIFNITGVSRALTHQLVRHRTAWFLQQSQRSVNPFHYKEWYVIPPKIKASPTLLGLYEDTMNRAKVRYLEMISHGIRKEDARFLLPNACKTNIFMKIDGSNLMHFLKLRNAQWEIKELAEKIHELVKGVAPNLFSEDLEEYWW